MTVLLDHNVPRGIRRGLRGHVVLAAEQRGWSLIENGDLLRAGETEGFTVFLMCDKDFLKYESDRNRRIAIVFLTTNHWPSLRAAHQSIREEVEASTLGNFARVEIERLRSKRESR